MSTTSVMERETTKTQPTIAVLRDRLLQRRTEIEHALEGSGTSADRFIRAAVTTAMMQPELVSDVSFQSLWVALLEACRDGLLPDGRQGWIIPYKGKARWQKSYRGMLDRFEQSAAVLVGRHQAPALAERLRRHLDTELSKGVIGAQAREHFRQTSVDFFSIRAENFSAGLVAIRIDAVDRAET